MRAGSSALVFFLCCAAACAPGAAPDPAVAAPRPVTAQAAAEPSSASAGATPAAPDPGAGATVVAAEPEIPREDVRASNTFAVRLYARVKRAPGNVLVSATSVRDALAITLLGARGDTARELAAALVLPDDPARAAAVAKAETAAWNEARGASELIVASRVWSDQAFTLDADFVAAARASFGAAVSPVDFAAGATAARRTINAWAAEQTASKISEVLPEGAVDTKTKLVVTNAVYLKARWASPFAKAGTKDEAFHGFGRATTVPMMHATTSHAFAKVDGAKLLGMRYDGTPLAILIVLPDDPSAAALAKVEDKATAETFEAWTKAIAAQRVAVSLPRFSFAWGGGLESALKDLGVHEAFGPKADFSAIAASPPSTKAAEHLTLSRVLQKTWVSVDEAGTEAAAASGVAMSTMSATLGPIAELKADHPFLFFVYDARQGRILFSGRVTDPRS